MKTAWIVACALLFVSAAGFADGPAPVPLTDEALAAILGEPVAGSSCATQSGVRLAAVQGQKGPVQLDCGNGLTLAANCTGTTTVVDRNCPFERGHIVCNGVTVAMCPPCPCTGGTPLQNACCQCDGTGDCFACCRCSGGTISQCSEACS